MNYKPINRAPRRQPSWMITFADMVTLLLAFFILLFTFAQIDLRKFAAALGSIHKELGTSVIRYQGEVPQKTSLIEFPHVQSSLNPLLPVRDALENMIFGMKIKQDLSVIETKRGIILRVKGKTFFNAGSDEILEDSFPILDKIGDIMNKFKFNVSIEGHTDNAQLTGGKFKSNWELSSARAISVLRYLQGKKHINVSAVYVAGFADSHPIDNNDTPEGKSNNRRVEFVFSPDG
ncbi:MAG: flagellar motor protein MotB [Nitrospirae bacterium]|nr:flagellar motor protein MotB [Nitrospirota bacterium]